MGLLKFIFWFLFIYYLIKILFRFFFPIIIKYFANKMRQRFDYQFNQKSDNQSPFNKKEGSVTIEKTKKSHKSRSDNLGEYVDFEEVN